jgi:hypothetical protein
MCLVYLLTLSRSVSTGGASASPSCRFVLDVLREFKRLIPPGSSGARNNNLPSFPASGSSSIAQVRRGDVSFGTRFELDIPPKNMDARLILDTGLAWDADITRGREKL